MDETIELVFMVIGFMFLVAAVVAIVTALATIGGVYGAGVSIYNYAVAIGRNIKPEKATGNVPAKSAGEPAIKSYFFGKGYQDLKATIAASHRANLDFVEIIKQRASAEGFGVMQAAYIGAVISCLCYGTVFFGLLSAIHVIILGLVMAAIFVLFTAVYLIERLYLAFRGFLTVCPACHERTPLPVYRCDACGEKHSNLIPSSYGTFHHRCTCGQKLPSTFFLNRGRLPALCANCGHSLSRANTETRKLFVPVIGGPSTGKTAYLVWLVDSLRLRAVSKGMEIEFLEKTHEAEYVNRLMEMHRGHMPPKTVDTTPRALNLNFLDAQRSHRNLYLYDPAGEAFLDGGSLVPHQFLSYCSGILFLVDPFSIPAVHTRFGITAANSDALRPSLQQPDELIDRLLVVLEKDFGLDPSSSINVPLAVVLTKVDAFNLEAFVGDTRFKSLTDEERQIARSKRISDQLRDWEMVPLVEVVERRFNTCRFFSCSSIGLNHRPGTGFTPARIDEPFFWLMREANTGLLAYDGAPAVNSAAKPTATPQTRRRWRLAVAATATAVVALIMAGAAKVHFDENATYDQVGENPRKLAEYLTNCTICWRKTEATEQVRKLQAVADTQQDERDYQAAKGNLERLQQYFDHCRICTRKSEAKSELDGLKKQALASQEERSYQNARGNPDALRLFATSCQLCTQKAAALAAIRELESYFNYEVCNSTRFPVSVAVMGKKKADIDQWSLQGWLKLAVGACASIGKFAKGVVYSTALVTGEFRGWFGAGPKQCVDPTVTAFERTVRPNTPCDSSGTTLNFASVNVTGAQYKWQITGEPVWPSDAFFAFQVCNRTMQSATVAITGREAGAPDTWIVQGWWNIEPRQCRQLGRFAKGAFFATAEALNPPARWVESDVRICAPHGTFFKRNYDPNTPCRREDMVPFKNLNLTDANATWQLVPTE